MARIQKDKRKNDDIEFDIELEKGVMVHAVLGNEVDNWLKNIRHQLIVWRNIPVAEQISQHDESVKKLCKRYGVDSRKPKGTRDREIVSNVIGFVRRSAIEANQQLATALVGLKFLKNAFYLDEIANQFKLRTDIAALFEPDEISDAIDRYFDNQPVEHGPAFPTYQTEVAAEYLFPLMALLVENFDIDLQIESAIEKHNIRSDTEEVEETIDDAGFPSAGLDTVLED